MHHMEEAIASTSSAKPRIYSTSSGPLLATAPIISSKPPMTTSATCTPFTDFNSMVVPITTTGSSSTTTTTSQNQEHADIVGAPVDYTYHIRNLNGRLARYPQYDFTTYSIELCRANWTNTDEQRYLRGCRWSPDGTCLLTVVRGAGMHVFELPLDLYNSQMMYTSREICAMVPAISLQETGLIYDYCWYPGMNSNNPATCCWASTGHEGPINVWDAYTGNLRCSYRGYDNLDQMETAMGVTFSADGQHIFGGYKKSIKIFWTGRPGREFVTYPMTHSVTSLAASLAQPGIVAIGSWKNNIELVSQSDGSFRHLHNLQGHRGGTNTLAFSACGTRLYSGGRRDTQLICWDLRIPGQPLFTVTRASNTNQRIGIALSCCDHWLATGGTDGKVQIWNVEQETLPTAMLQLPLHQDCVNDVSFHPFKPILATSSGQHHTQDPLHHTRNSQTYDNSLCMWWVGKCQDDPDFTSALQQLEESARS